MPRTEPDASRRERRPSTAQRERADELFDTVSSALRDVEEPGSDPAIALRRADRAFETLHRHLERGGVLPGPWSRARHP
ncbi:hypothetical protein [Nocardiopsis lambiniae]|uniref:SAV-6107-like HEPN domain-containing protein n=1 Tax=Nocardiopsis lambiniae TaxID=3075539 RepID=A0ABU2M6S1_9ACTN|nr:hypothetical protein [Nocardiopsis sp. DSM 44743]MDT0328373.1 hypothetical protein [Nocardiopsis sp. DSM 44743]